MDSLDRYNELIMSFLRGTCTTDEARELLTWLSESNDHKVHFDLIKSVWDITNFHQPKSYDIEAALHTVNESIDQLPVTEVPVRHSWFRRNLSYVASSAAAIAIVLCLSVFFKTNTKPQTLPLAAAEYNASHPYVLSDGTRISVEEDALITIPSDFNETSRPIDFDGVAQFDVAKDASRPFLIHCGDLEIEVLGTSFRLDARHNAEEYQLDLLTGKVCMRAANNETPIILMPGERGRFLADSQTFLKYSALEVVKDKALNDHVLDFNNAKLSDIVDILEYVYEVNIDLDERYNDNCLTARLQGETFSDVLETLAMVFEMQVDFQNDVYYIR